MITEFEIEDEKVLQFIYLGEKRYNKKSYTLSQKRLKQLETIICTRAKVLLD